MVLADLATSEGEKVAREVGGSASFVATDVGIIYYLPLIIKFNKIRSSKYYASGARVWCGHVLQHGSDVAVHYILIVTSFRNYGTQ